VTIATPSMIAASSPKAIARVTRPTYRGATSTTTPACNVGAAPADVLDLAEPELEEDRVDVLLHRALGEERLVGDRLVAAAARLDLSLQVELPKLLSPALGGLCDAIAADDELAGDAVIEGVLDELDMPLERARLARAVMRDAGRCPRPLAAFALIDLASGSRQLVCASVIQAVAVRAGVARTPGGVLLAA
jgi:hypothetical protein